jgi:hypothetical protein
MEMYGGVLILNLGTKLPGFILGDTAPPRYTLDRGLGEPQTWSAEQKHIFPLS